MEELDISQLDVVDISKAYLSTKRSKGVFFKDRNSKNKNNNFKNTKIKNSTLYTGLRDWITITPLVNIKLANI